MKFLSVLIIFVLCFLNFFSYTLFVKASSFYISSQKVSLDTSTFTNQQDELNVLPNQLFRLESYLQNNTGNPISGITYYTNFTNGILYQQETPRSFPAKNGSSIQGSISLDEFNPNSIPNYYNSVTLENSSTYQMRRILLKFPENWSTYENNLSSYFTASGGYTSDTKETKIYVNVHPHIFDYYFEKADGSQTINQIQGNDAEPINLVVKVKDYNGCSNISGGTVSANLSQLGLGTSESLSYQSCEADGKTAIFKKTGITTNVAVGNYTFNYNDFTATDINGNNNLPNDPIFGNPNNEANKDDKKTPLLISVVPSLTPVINFVSLSENLIGGPDKQSSILTVTSTYSGSIQAKIGSDTNCNGGTVIEGITNYIENTDKSFTINSSSLNEGNNTIYVCLEKDGYIGSLSRQIIKDTTSPTITNPSYTVNVSLNNSNITFSCGENGHFAGELRGTSTLGSGVGTLNWTSTTAGTINTYTALNSDLLTGPNLFHVFCRDNATNISFKTGSITKTIPVLSMNGLVDSLTDNDFDNEGLDGRDITINWTKPAGNNSNFLQYELYILPYNIGFDQNQHKNYLIKYVQDENINTFTGLQEIKKDSTNTSFISGGKYKACVLIRGKDLAYGEIGCSSPAILTSDVVLNAKITSAKFTSNTTLELTTDTTLDTNLSSHTGGLISYVYNGNTINPTGVLSVSGKKINLIIPNLNNIGATGSNILMQTGALRSQGGGFNNYQTFNTITDGQLPTISGFVNNTALIYNNYFSGSIDVSFNFGENMKGAGSTKIVFDRTSGNASPQKIFNITNNSNLTSGNHNETISLSGLLVSGTKYNMKIIGEDLAGNSINTGSIVVGFDNTGPSKPTLIHRENTSSTTPTLTWNASNDDSGNGVGVDKYILKIYNGNSCLGQEIQTLESTTTSKITNTLSNGTYSWNLSPIDKLGNIGQISNCDSFLIDTTIPTIENLLIKDININSTSFTSSGNDLEITANLTNTDLNHISADLSLLTGNSSHTGVICGSPISGITCSYNLGIVKYSFKTGFAGNTQENSKNITLNVSTPSGVTTISKNLSITIDNTPPNIANIISPINQTYGGNSLNISWNGLSDNNLEKVFIAYKKESGSYVDIYSGANISPYNLDITNFVSGNYQIKITGKDRAGNTSFKESSIFTLDKTKPVILNTVFTSIVNGSYIKGNQVFNITWNSGDITDAGGLSLTPITLEYSTNSGGNWNIIAQNLVNNGSYNWNIGSINSKEVKLRIKAIDTFGNESNYIESNLFTIDSSAPLLNLEVGTPPNGVFINSNGFDIIATLSDNIELKEIFLNFKNTSSNTYWNGNSYSGVNTWVKLKDLTGINYNLNELFKPTIINGNTYNFTLKVVDKSGNETLSTTREYIGDTINPTLNITNTDNSYFSGSLNILGTSSDSGAGISSVKISIKKGNNYWNGSSFVGSQEILATQTSNNYANWNYNFIAPSNENDGENYEIIIYVYDKSYKVNNTSSGNINIILDKTGPVIDSDIFTINTSGVFLGGSDFLITWDKTKIISSGAILKVNPITLEFFNGNNWQLVGNNLENSGSYNFTLPLVDINNAKFRITSFDEINNPSNTVLSNNFLIDSTPPTINSVETMDLNANGQIDALQIFFSESILDNSINLSDFNIEGIGTPTSWETGMSVDDNIFILKFNDFGDTSSTPKLNYTKGSLTDLSGKKLENISSKSSVDKASPRVLNTEIFANNSGIFNKIEVYFSENINSTTDITAFVLNNGLTINSVSISGNKAILNLDLGSVNTDSNGYNLLFTSNSFWKDLAGNDAGSLGTEINLADKAKPVLISYDILDTNLDFIADKISLVFSENMSGSLAGFLVNTGSLSNGNLEDNKITFDISGVLGTSPNIILNYTGDLEDNYSNKLDNITNLTLKEKISPKIINSYTLDQNGNGKIDGIEIEFSEDINSDFSDFNIVVSGYSLNNTSTYTKSGNNKVIVSLNEKQIFDTEITPLISINLNSSLKDINQNNILLQSSNTIDKVGPVIVGARFDSVDKKMYLDFSENISTNLTNSSFVLSQASASIVNTTFSSGSNFAVLELNSTGIDIGVSEISFAGNSVGDSFGNKQLNTYFSKILGGVIINEIMSVGDVKYIELKNISSSSVDISNWTIKNALGNGNDYTIPASQTILANNYYLISTSNTYFSGITSNQIASLDINSDIILKNGNIVIDSALYQVGENNTSLERLKNCGNGLSNICWYKAVGSEGFINNSYKGTPKSDNILDVINPEVTTNMVDNLILPIGNYDLKYNYNDNIGVLTGSINFKLEKWDGNNFIFNNSFTTGSVDLLKANYILSGLSYGKYKATFSIKDTSGNIGNDIKIFYVDDFSFSLSTGSVNLGALEPNELTQAQDNVIVTIKTLGAGFDFTHSYLGDWEGNMGYGACEGISCNDIQNYKSKVFSQTGELQTSGELKTYKYYIKYGSLVDELKPAGVYQIENKYNIEIRY